MDQLRIAQNFMVCGPASSDSQGVFLFSPQTHFLFCFCQSWQPLTPWLLVCRDAKFLVVQELCKGAAIRCGSPSAMQPGAMSHDGLVAILPPYCTIFLLHLTFAKTGKKQTVFVHRCSKTMPEHNED